MELEASMAGRGQRTYWMSVYATDNGSLRNPVATFPVLVRNVINFMDSSSSASSVSSASSQSSQSSESSASSVSSASSESSPSSLSTSSESSASSQSSLSSISTSDSSSNDCQAAYWGKSFTTDANANGKYDESGSYLGNPKYVNGNSYWLWYDSGYKLGRWIVSSSAPPASPIYYADMELLLCPSYDPYRRASDDGSEGLIDTSS